MIRDLADVTSSLTALAGRPVAAAEVSHEVDAALQRVLGYDGWVLIGFDPLTGHRTAQLGGRGIGHSVEMARNESVMTDVNKYVDLAQRPVPVGWLSPEHPKAKASFRLNEVLLPQGLASEVRLALHEGGRLWGALVLFRESGRRPFGEQDTEPLCAVAGPLTHVLRAYPVRGLRRAGTAPEAGVVALDPHDRVVFMSEPARAWLADLVPGGSDQTDADDVVRMVFDVAEAVRRGATASSCVRTVRGHWLRVEGTPVALGAADVLVVLRPAVVDELLDRLAAYRGLTARELDVLRLAARGLPGKHVARELSISLHTVNGHLRSVYRACGVTGRDELLGMLA